MRRASCFIAMSLVPLIAQTGLSHAVEAEEGGDAAADVAVETVEVAEAFHPESGRSKPEFLILPVPFSDPSTGTGVAAGVVAFYNPNGGRHQWTSALGGVWTSRDSKGIALVHNMYSADDRFRLNATASWFDRHDRYYGIGAEDGDRNDALLLANRQLELKLRGLLEVTNDIYVGVQYRLMTSNAVPEQGQEPGVAVPPAKELGSTLSMLGPVLLYDTRDNNDETRQGVNIGTAWLFGIKALGDTFSHSLFTAHGNAYHALGAKTVLVGRASFCAAGGDAAYYALCQYGSGKNLRGYPSDRYRDRAYWAVQGEIRHQFASRWGGVAFFGVGGIAPSIGDILSDSNSLPAGGVGIRYRPFKNNDVRLRLDMAFGKDASGVYLGIGEAF